MALAVQQIAHDNGLRNILRQVPNGSVLYYPGLEGGGSSIFDYSGNGNHGTIVGATWSRLPSGLWVPNFDGDDYIEVTVPQMNFTTEDFTILAWWKTTNLTTTNYILSRGLANTDGYLFTVIASGAIYFITDQAAAQQSTISTVGAVAINNWYRLGITRSGASVRIYKNGLDVTSTVGTHINPATCARTVKIGIYDDKITAPLIGSTIGITVISAALTPAQIAGDLARDRGYFGA